MKIVADENIPLLDAYFGANAELVLKTGRLMSRKDLLDADVLLVRSVTPVNRELLHDTPVKFVGTVSTGMDHLDAKWLDRAGILWRAAEGCNAVAVVEYVVSVVAALQKMAILPKKNLRAGVIGVGRIGRQVVDKLTLLGFEVLQCDPLRALEEEGFRSTPIEAFADLDFITLHTPLTRAGRYATYHMINKLFLMGQKKNCVLLNAGRGAVIDFSDLDVHGRLLYWCLDVWENEPVIDLGVLQSAVIATPHIAGYSLQSKYRGTEMIYRAARQLKVIPEAPVSTIPFPQCVVSFGGKKVDWRDVVLEIYDPRKTTKQMQEVLMANSGGDTFDVLRKSFGSRYEFSCVTIEDAQLSEEDALIVKKLGISFASVSRI